MVKKGNALQKIFTKRRLNQKAREHIPVVTPRLYAARGFWGTPDETLKSIHSARFYIITLPLSKGNQNFHHSQPPLLFLPSDHILPLGAPDIPGKL